MRTLATWIAVMCTVGAQAAEIEWKPTYKDALAIAKSSKKLVMVDFYTDWCGWCKKLDKDTYPDEAVVRQAGRFVSVKVNAEKEDGPAIAKKYSVDGFPTIVFLSPDEKLVYKVVGYLPPKQFAAEMTKANDAFVNRPKYEARVKANPKDIEALASLVPIYAATGEIDAAKSAYGQADKLDPTNQSGKLSAAYNAMGDLYQNANKPEEAVPYFEKAAAGKDKAACAYALISLAYCQATMQKPKLAIPYLKRLLAMGKEADEYREQAQAMLKQLGGS